MIARICGILFNKSPQFTIIDVNGVGYQVFVPLTTYYELPKEGEPVSLYIYTHVKDDGINLFGFHLPLQRDIFQLLLGVSGVGPKLAISILSGIEINELLLALAKRDVKRLATIPGVGEKTAERICLELKKKVAKLTTPGEQLPAEGREKDKLLDDALSALVNLGYKPHTAKKALDKASLELKTGCTLDNLLKNALKILAT